MTRAGRGFLAALLTLLATVAMLVTLLAQYANHVLVSPSGFSDRAVSVLHTGAVQSLVAQAVTDRLVASAGGETSVQPVIQSAVLQAVSSTQVDSEFRGAATSLHNQLISGTADDLVLSLPDIGAAIAPSVESESPALAEQVRGIGTITVLDVPIPPSDAKNVHDLASAAKDSSKLLIGTVLLVLLALIIAANRRRTLIGLGIGAVVSGLAAVAIYLAGRGIVVSEFSSQDAVTAARAVWSTYLGGLEIRGFVLAGVGAVLACVAKTVR
jgi:hypothetical protein